MTRLGKWLGLIVAVCGFAAAHVVVQAGSAMQLPVPTPTVTVPPVPAPTVPVPPPVPPPTTPTVTVPVPPPPPPAPVPPPTTTPVPVPAPPPPPVPPVLPAPPTAPTIPPASTSQPSTPPVTAPSASGGAASRPEGSAQAPGDPAPPPGSSPVASSGSAPTAGSAASASAAPRAAVRSRALEARRLKTRNRVSVRLTFSLPRADRVFLIVRGPAPDCEIAGYIPVRGRKGINKVTFAGRVLGRLLEPGIYLISVSTSRRLAPAAATEPVRVISPRRSVPLADSARKPSCNDAGGLATNTAARIALGGFVPVIAAPTVRPAQPSRATTPQNGADADADDDAEASSFIPDAGILGVATGDAADEPFVAFAVLTLLAALLFAMVTLVTRFIRGSWNP